MQNKLYDFMDWPEIEAVVYAEQDNPHKLLGPHKMGKQLVFQTFWPGAKSVHILLRDEKRILDMEKVDEQGYFAAMIPFREQISYQYEVEGADGSKQVVEDPYRFPPFLEQGDLELFHEGTHYEIYKKMGCHPMVRDGIAGCNFAVWAPNAVAVMVQGDFNSWNAQVHQMRRLGDSGVFELFIPGVKEGVCYKYAIKTKDGQVKLHADPYSRAQELPDNTASLTFCSKYAWKDDDWISQREKRDIREMPVNIYECLLSDIKDRKPEDFASEIKEKGYTHVGFLPIMEYLLEESKGYRTSAYYAPTRRYGTPDDFKRLVDCLHDAEIGVVLSWVPTYFPAQEDGLSNFDGTCLYEHLDRRQGYHEKWNALVFQYGKGEVDSFLIANALYWVEEFHADGILVEDLAGMLYLNYGRGDGEWVPNMFGGYENLEAIDLLKHLNSIMKKRNPGVMMIAAEDSGWENLTAPVKENGLGFDLCLNFAWAKDFTSYMEQDPYFRTGVHDTLTLSMVYAYKENYILSFPGELTREALPGKEEDREANLRLALSFFMLHPGKKMTRNLSFGNEKTDEMVKELNKIYCTYPTIYASDCDPDGFEWVDALDARRCKISFLRLSKTGRRKFFVLCNFSNVERKIRIGVKVSGTYEEVFNSDAEKYGGKGRINPESIKTGPLWIDGYRQSLKVNIAPLSLSVFMIKEI